MVNYIIYSIKNIINNKEYIGITSSGIDTRIKRHIDDALCRNRGKANSLQSAIRNSYNEGDYFEDHFFVSVIHGNMRKKEAGKLENELIKQRKTLAPYGYNIIKGGGSFGSTANAKEISFRYDSEIFKFDSVQKAVNFVNDNIHSKNGTSIKYGTVSARIRSGHDAESALGISELVDRRKFRESFKCNGKYRNAIAEAADELGLNIDSLRSRIYRNRHKLNHDVSLVAISSKQDKLVVPDPTVPDKFIAVSEFSRITGIPASTVLWRYRRLKETGSDGKMSRQDLISHLIAERKDRRKIIRLTLPNGDVLIDGVNQLCKRVLSSPTLIALQKDNVNSISTIKARLRRSNYKNIEWCFGFTSPWKAVHSQKKPLSRRLNAKFKSQPFFSANLKNIKI